MMTLNFTANISHESLNESEMARHKQEFTLPQSIKLSTDQMRLMSLFQNVTGATARDCVEDEKQNRVIFVVNEGKMGLAIGKGGSHLNFHEKCLQ